MDPQFRVTVTAIIEKDGKFLITQRAADKKRYPNMWTVPGGGVEVEDYDTLPVNKDGVRYGILEAAIRREVKQEVGLEINNLRYVCSMTLGKINADPVVVISLHADWASGDVTLNEESQRYAWVDLLQSKSYNLIDGIYGELESAAYSTKGDPSQVTFRWTPSIPHDQRDDIFIQGMLDRMGFGYYNYGHMRRRHDRPDNVKNLLIRLIKYAGYERVMEDLHAIISSGVNLGETGNTEFLIDAANYAMMEFSVPSHPEAYFRPTEARESPGSHVSGRIIKNKSELAPTWQPRQKEGD